jgi:hypothetical protein
MKRLNKEKSSLREEDQFVTYNEMVNFVIMALIVFSVSLVIGAWLFSLI